jgi:RNA-directed DNA polymerase
MRALRGGNAVAVIATLNPIISGSPWAAYYGTVVSTRVFAALTEYLWKLTYKWACWSHPKSRKLDRPRQPALDRERSTPQTAA